MLFSEFVAYLSKHKRSAVLGLATQMLWQMWKEPQRFDLAPSDPHGKEVHYVKAYAARVAALAAVVCAEDGASIDARGIAQLCVQYGRIQEPDLPDDIQAIRASWASHHALRDFPLPDDVVHRIGVFMPVHRNLSAQVPPYASWKDILRSWYLLDLTRKQAMRTLGRDLADDTKKVLNGVSPENAVIATYSFLAMVGTSPNHSLDIAGSTNPDGLAENLGITFDDILIMADRLSFSCDELRDQWFAAMAKLPVMIKKFARDPFAIRPLLRLDPSFEGVPARTGHYLCVSPRHYLAVLGQLPFEILRTVESLTRENLQTLLGYAIEEYLAVLFDEWCGSGSVVRVDDLIREKDKRGDLVVFCGDRAFLVETTKSIGTPEMRSSYSAEQLLAQWTVLKEKALQCEATLAHPRFVNLLNERRVTSVVSLVVVHDSLFAEASLFSDVAQRTGLLRPSSRVEFTTVTELERIMDKFTPLQLHAVSEMKWNRGEGSEPLGTYAEKMVQPLAKARISWRVVRQSAAGLLPEFLLQQLDELEQSGVPGTATKEG